MLVLKNQNLFILPSKSGKSKVTHKIHWKLLTQLIFSRIENMWEGLKGSIIQYNSVENPTQLETRSLRSEQYRYYASIKCLISILTSVHENESTFFIHQMVRFLKNLDTLSQNNLSGVSVKKIATFGFSFQNGCFVFIPLQFSTCRHYF